MLLGRRFKSHIQGTEPIVTRLKRVRLGAIEVGEEIQLRFAVRDRLVNVWLGDEFVIDYRLPSRSRGSLSISGFDATVSFDSISIRSLPTDVELSDVKSGEAVGPQDSQKAVELALAKREAAQAALGSLRATIAADMAKFRLGSKQYRKREGSARCKTSSNRCVIAGEVRSVSCR